ncbi:hypothetical protein HQ535_06295 [bacterium]|nr:hypothetical protein [bacterium]
MRRILIVLVLFALIAAACSDDGGSSTTIPEAATVATTTTTTTPSTTSTAPPDTTTTSAAPTTTTSTLPPGPNQAIIGSDWEPSSLSPFSPDGGSSNVMEIGQALFVGLTETHGGTLEIVPDLAVEIPTIASGGVTVAGDGTTTVTYRLHEEAVWEDGTPITADDVLFTYEAIMAIEGDWFDRADYEQIVTGSIVADGKVVSWSFPQPTLIHETMFPVILPRHQVEGTDPTREWDEIPWLSAGPFVFESWERGERISLVRNDRYWKTGPAGEALPHLDRLEFRFIPDPERLDSAFRNGEIDVYAPSPWPEAVDRIAAIEGVEVQSRQSPIWEHFTFQFGNNNRNEDSLNRHLPFRQAVAHLIDREAIAALGFWATDLHLDGILDLTGLPGTEPWSRYDHDVDEARRLLAELCADLGRDCDADPPKLVFSTTSNADERPAIARLLVDMLGAGGIEVELQLEDSSLFFGPTLDNGTWDLGQWAWIAAPGAGGALGNLAIFDPGSPVTGDPNVGSQSYTGSNFARWGTSAVTGQPLGPERSFGAPPGTVYRVDLNQGPSLVSDEHSARYEDLIDLMEATADIDEFTSLAIEAEQILADQVVFIPLSTRNAYGAVWASRIDGYVYSPWNQTWNVEKWRRADR